MASTSKTAGEDGVKAGATSSGLAVLLSGEENPKDKHRKSHLISSCDDLRYPSAEAMLEHVFDLPSKSLILPDRAVDVDFTRKIIKDKLGKHENSKNKGSGSVIVLLDESSFCGNLRSLLHPLRVEGGSMFSSGRAKACVSRGKWMYEVELETAGVLQIGWATLACPFTDRKGVGDAEDSYAFDGKRMRKWNKESKPYGQPWIAGDVIGCCIDLEEGEISFYRNGESLGLAFSSILRTSGERITFHPAISLSKGERCFLNFGGQPFKYPVESFLPIQPPPVQISSVNQLLRSLSRILDLQNLERLMRSKKFPLLDSLFRPISRGICEELFEEIQGDNCAIGYLAESSFLPFLLERFSRRPPHNEASLDRAIDLFLEFDGSRSMFFHLILSLSSSCRTSPLVLLDCPFSGSYPFLSLARQILSREELLTLWWRSPEFKFLLEGFLSMKAPNKNDIQRLIPAIQKSSEELYLESSMIVATSAISGAFDKIEGLHRELCRTVIEFIPPGETPGSVFRMFLRDTIEKSRTTDYKTSSNNSALLSIYTVILHFLSEGSSPSGISERSGGFLHRPGKRSFPTWLLFKADPFRAAIPRLGGSFFHLPKLQEREEIIWEEGCLDSEETKVTHSGLQKPCCCCSSGSDSGLMKMVRNPSGYLEKGRPAVGCSPISESSSGQVANLNDEIVEKPRVNIQSHSDGCQSPKRPETLPSPNAFSSAALREAELLDALLFLYNLGASASFKQAFYYKSHQTSLGATLEEVDRQMRETGSEEQHRALKEARNVYREELVDCARQSAWYHAALSSRWKQRGTYGLCIWVAELLVVLSRDDDYFQHAPEFYLETLVDCVLSLSRSNPPFVSSAILIKQGLSSFVTLAATHFDDPRIASDSLKDLLLQSISFLVREKDFAAAFESNKLALERMPGALLASFDQRSWVLVANVINHLCCGSGFGPSKHGDSSSSALFQTLLREACIADEKLLSSFLNRLFNTLSMMMTEFSILMRDTHDSHQLFDPQHRKCGIVFDLSCSLTRILEFFTSAVPCAFLADPTVNLRRLTEMVIFMLGNLISSVDSEFFDAALRRHGHHAERMTRGMMLGPLVGIIVNLAGHEGDDLASMFASMDSPAVHFSLQFLLGYDWGSGACGAELGTLERFAGRVKEKGEVGGEGDGATDGERCCICYDAEADAVFEPCSHRSCFGCITRHLLNGHRCFFCNAAIADVLKLG